MPKNFPGNLPNSCASHEVTADIDTVNCRNGTVHGDGDLNLPLRGTVKGVARGTSNSSPSVTWSLTAQHKRTPETRSIEQVQGHGKGCPSPDVPPGGKMTGCVFGQGDGTRSTEEPAGLPPAFLLVSLLRCSPRLSSHLPCLHAKAKIQSSFVIVSCACAYACCFVPSRFRCRLTSQLSFSSPEDFFLAQLECLWLV